MDHFTIKIAGSGGSKTLVILIKRESVGDDNGVIEEDEDSFDISMPLDDTIGVEVGPSNCPGAGDGLFATKDFRKDEIVTYYGGRTYTKGSADLLDKDASYFWAPMKEDYVIDGRYQKDEHKGRFINDPQYDKQNICGNYNVKFDTTDVVKQGDYAWFPVKATENIVKGSELFGNYKGGGRPTMQVSKRKPPTHREPLNLHHRQPRERRPVSPTVINMLSGLHRNEERSQNEENKFVKRFKFLAAKDESRKDKLDSLQKFADDRKDIFTVDQRLNINKKLRTFPIKLSGRNWALSGSGPTVSQGGSIGLTLPSAAPNYGSKLTMSSARYIK